MLYEIHEMQHALLAPWVSFAEASLGLYTSPFSPLSYFPVSQRLAAGSELMLRLTQRYTKPLWQIEDTQVDGMTVPVCDVAVLEKPFCKLIHFERAFVSARKDPKVLLVAPLSGHHATLLRDTVRTMLPEHEVYVTDWVDARMVPVTEGPFHLDDYVDYVREFVNFIGEGVHVISVCQPTVPVLAAISLIAQHDDPVKPRSMTMMGGPIDARKSPTAVNNLATEKPLSWFKRSVIQRVPLKYPGYMRQVYPGFLQHTGFVAMNPSRHAEAHWDFYNHLLQGDGESAEAHRKFYDEYNAVLDMPAEYYIDTIKTVFQEFAHVRARGTGQAGGDQEDGAADHRRRVRRYFRQRTDCGRARFVHRSAGKNARPLSGAQGRALRHFQRKALARSHLSAYPRLHTQARLTRLHRPGGWYAGWKRPTGAAFRLWHARSRCCKSPRRASVGDAVALAVCIVNDAAAPDAR
jgi:poly(3-hydroxybutyrate) depolymerase